MSKKIGRNDPCPCGSGKKYKKCCLNSDRKFELPKLNFNKNENKTFQFIKSNNSTQLLNFIISLQLNPKNHGKNIRIEELAKQIVINLNNRKQNGNLELFKQYLDNEFASNHMEDIPENLYCENIVFYGGNYTVFPGISTNAVEIFKNLTEIIFTQENNLPDEFKYQVFSGIILILELGKILYTKYGIKGNIEGGDNNKKFDYTFKTLNASFSKEEIIHICEKHKINPKILTEFIVKPNDQGLINNDPDKNPLLKKPILHFENKYYFVLISNQVNALNEFIIRNSNKYGCNKELTELYHNKLWHENWGACDNMGWKLTDIKLPKNNQPTILKERIFQFDTNILAYTCYLHNDKDEIVFSHPEFNLNERINEVISTLKSNPQLKNYKFLSIINFENMGRNIAISLGIPQKNEYRLTFSIHHFNLLSYSEKWNNLSLWKFAKLLHYFSQSTNFTPYVNTLDFYSIYKSNNSSFYLNDGPRPDFLLIVPGEGNKLIKEAKIKRNYHGILSQVNNNNVYIPSIRYATYAPLYKPIKNLGYYAICLESYNFPIWIVNQIKNDSMVSQVKIFAEAIGFWLNKIKPGFEGKINSNKLNYLIINIQLDEMFFEDIQISDIIEAKNISDYTSSLEGNVLFFTIPFSKMKTFIGSDNYGEREMIKALIKGIKLIDGIDLSHQEIENIIDKFIPLSNAKMILLTDSQNDPLIDKRWLLKPFYISNAEVELLLDEIPLLVEETIPIPKNITKEEDKKELFNTLTKLLLEKLEKEIQIFEFEFLIHTLLELNESLIWRREQNKTMIPAQILCFGDIQEELKEIIENDNKLIKTSLATRCLIEYVAAQPPNGNIKAGLDDIDRLLVLMHEIINYGLLSDAIHFKLSNPSVGMLESGRIGISREFFEDKLKPFAQINAKEEASLYIENFNNRFELSEYSQENIEEQQDKEIEEIDTAFLEDWGISYSNINKFCYAAYVICVTNQTSTYSMKEEEFIQEIKSITQINEKEIIAGIERFSLTKRENYLKAPQGYKDSEVFPWKYNREFSSARRFIVKYKNNKDETILTWGFRNAISAQKQLAYLLFEGKLNNGGKKINKILGTFRERKGKIFRNKVKDWLKKNPNLIVIDYEVKIDINGHLKANKNYGDIDILVYDKNSNIVYSIECKDTNKAKNIHEMKKEMDNYLGREGQKGMIQKHIKRHKWLNSNKDKLGKLLKTGNKLKIISFMLTSEVIPTTYLKAGELPLPIVSFPELKKEGIKILETLQ